VTAPDPAAPLLEVRGLLKRYGKSEVLRGVDLSGAGGEVYGFLGKNGAGKTTTLRALMGIHRTDGGTIRYFGEEVSRPRRRHKRLIGYVSQEQRLYPWMRCEQLGRFVRGFYPTWDDAEFTRLLEVLDLPAKRRVSELSGGMKVKLALALALAHRPKLLLLDEPTSGLDPAARREFLEIVTQQAQGDGRTTVFSSHIVEEVERVSTTVGILDRGRMQFEGRPARLLEEVRRLRSAPGARDNLSLPDGAVVLSHRREPEVELTVVRAAPEAWERLRTGPETQVERLKLEDAFLAIATGRVASS
jgi:ABC-2 type transport system ATP-binding protein